MKAPTLGRTLLYFFLKLQKRVAGRMIRFEQQRSDSLFRWRVNILSAILVSGILFGSAAFVSALGLILRENTWGLAVVDGLGVLLCLVFLFVIQIPFKVRSTVSLISFFIIGAAVILSVGPLSGGPFWLFAFAVLSGVLIGHWAALGAVLLNTCFLGVIGYLIYSGRFGHAFPFFNTPQAMVAALVNFIVLNAITSVSVSALLNGLNESEAKYRMIAENVDDVIWSTDLGLGFTYVSPSVTKMQGYTADECLSMSANEVLVPDSQALVLRLYEKKMAQIQARDPEGWEPEVFEVQQIRKDGSLFWAHVNARLIPGPDEFPEGILGITRDVTLRKKEEAEKIKAQIHAGEQEKLALVGQIAGKMAHDFNNVLGIIMGNAELALMDKRNLQNRHVFQDILNQTIRGKNLTRNLISFAKSSEPKQTLFLIDEKIALVLDLFAGELQEITVVTDRVQPYELIADPGMIEHALVNLLQNSIHAVSRVKEPRITLSTFSANGQIIIRIEDNGCGIPSPDLDKVFDPAFTLKGGKDASGAYEAGIKGTGYGMANVKKYIDLHQGEIMIDSVQNEGTRIDLCLPKAEKELSPDEIRILRSSAPQTDKRILLVEDENDISDIQRAILEHPPLNHIVDIARTAEAAFSLFEENTYDLISLDYRLEGRLTGMDVYSRVRETAPRIPILFVSGNIEFLESMRQLQQNDPFTDHLSKPCRNMAFVESINRLMLKAG